MTMTETMKAVMAAGDPVALSIPGDDEL